MSQRPGVLVTVQRDTEAGVSPNAFVGRLQAEVRCHWTPYTPWSEVERAIVDAARQAITEAAQKYSEQGHPWPVGTGAHPNDSGRTHG